MYKYVFFYTHWQYRSTNLNEERKKCNQFWERNNPFISHIEAKQNFLWRNKSISFYNSTKTGTCIIHIISPRFLKIGERKEYGCLSFIFQVIKIMTWGCFRNKKWQELKRKMGKRRRKLIFVANAWLNVRIFFNGKKHVTDRKEKSLHILIRTFEKSYYR